MKNLKYFIYPIGIALFFYIAWIRTYKKDPEKYKINFYEATNYREFKRAHQILKNSIPIKTIFDHYYIYGISYENLKMPDSAIWHYKKSLDLDSNRLEVYPRLARVYYKQKNNTDSAKYYLNKGLLKDSLNLDLLREIGIYHYIEKDTIKSKFYLYKAFNINKKNSLNLSNLGLHHLKTKELDSAQYYFEKALEMNNDPYYLDEIHEQLGITLFNKSELIEAKKHFEKSYELVQLNENVNFFLGIIYANEKNHQKAIKHYTNSIRINDFDFKTFFNRAISYIEQDQYAEALSDLNKSIELNPTESEQYGVRATAKLWLNDERGACDDLKKTITLGNNRYNDLYNEMCK